MRILKEQSQFAATAQEEAEKINAQTGASYVTDQDFWEKQGVVTGEDLALTVLGQTYSDYFKEIHGYRPRHAPYDSVEEYNAAIKDLDDYYDSMVEQEELDAQQQAAAEKERQELAELMPGEFDFQDLPRRSGMGRRTESVMRINKRQLRRLIREQIEIITDEIADEAEVFGHGGTSKMAKSQLFQIAKNAQSLHDRLSDEDELPEWVQSKIAVMASHMDAVSDHLEYKMHRHETDEDLDNLADAIGQMIHLK